ncbi:TetR/AcrR family transcriptional regulator [Paraburkholderia terrae]|uniref:TetR/AcrR family transcriptional regulator n=1 Tax=Paraburkholderia terrae TaxID=311230 RepID=UPI00296A913A|nr:TetR/AcrR family transcriptional regulator [Paraburkholderia terrae]MDW3661046.1 TetR/AcrR family transcriptional regulator [Paraburkholderia terrae]
MEPASYGETKGRGRPRAFEREVALRRAMDLFWEKGFDMCSMSDLVDAMGVNSPSIYAAFGNKESLYREAIELYVQAEGGAALRNFESRATLRESLEAMFDASIDLFTGGQRSRGCMIFLGGAGIGAEHAELRNFLQALRLKVARTVEKRLKKAVEQGELVPDADAAALATLCMSVFSGLSVQAADGASKRKLHAGVAQLLAMIPFRPASHRAKAAL